MFVWHVKTHEPNCGVTSWPPHATRGAVAYHRIHPVLSTDFWNIWPCTLVVDVNHQLPDTSYRRLTQSFAGSPYRCRAEEIGGGGKTEEGGGEGDRTTGSGGGEGDDARSLWAIYKRSMSER